ncbi:hypothetical protein Tco_0556780 [Tanacetum coccineum]
MSDELVIAEMAKNEYSILPSDGADKDALAIQKKYQDWKGRKDYLTLRKKVVKIQAHGEQGGWENEGGTTSQLETAAGMETEELLDFV